MKKELFSAEDLNTLFNSSKAMHDEKMTRIDIRDGALIIEYGRIGENDYFRPFKKATVTYTLKDPDDCSLYVYRVKRNSLQYVSVPEGVSWLNKWNMLMFKYDIDIWGEMCLHFDINNGKKYYNARLSFTPVTIEYLWEE